MNRRFYLSAVALTLTMIFSVTFAEGAVAGPNGRSGVHTPREN